MSADRSRLGESVCQVCTDFKDWVSLKFRRVKSNSSTEQNRSDVFDFSTPQLTITEERPIVRDELGRATWSLLHTMASTFPEKPTALEQTSALQFIDALVRFYPCEECRLHWKKEVEMHPPDASNRKTLSLWLCEQHNAVNQRLGKDLFDCKRVDKRWKFAGKGPNTESKK
ncbi:hypothetical protein ACOME3_004036 [Neoechinorhynchus agilis]